ncbi:MAG: DUF3098 domain-containing protein [Salibacteraceae bacterium]
MEAPELPFKKKNYYLLAAAAALVLVGFALMSGGGSDDPTVFNPDVFSHRRISLAPTVVVVGYLLGIVAILYRPKSEV